jgi:hypothetical protein
MCAAVTLLVSPLALSVYERELLVAVARNVPVPDVVTGGTSCEPWSVMLIGAFDGCVGTCVGGIVVGVAVGGTCVAVAVAVGDAVAVVAVAVVVVVVVVVAVVVVAVVVEVVVSVACAEATGTSCAGMARPAPIKMALNPPSAPTPSPRVRFRMFTSDKAAFGKRLGDTLDAYAGATYQGMTDACCRSVATTGAGKNP